MSEELSRNYSKLRLIPNVKPDTNEIAAYLDYDWKWQDKDILEAINNTLRYDDCDIVADTDTLTDDVLSELIAGQNIMGHREADLAFCKVLCQLGYKKSVKAFLEMGKYYD